MKIPAELSAKTTWTKGQLSLLISVVVITVVAAIAAPGQTWWFLNVVLMAGFIFVVAGKIASVLGGLLLHDTEEADEAEIAALRDEDLPIYTILIPMYKEPKMVAGMLRNLQAMDYPADKLDAKLLLEANDIETQQAAAALELPPWFQVVVVEDGTPKTKPRACNVGLEQARGEFLVIYDAEDRPEPDQLKKSIAVFRRSSSTLSCLQARLNYYNPHQNMLTRWFTLEYSTWFDLFLPGLHTLGSPIPLGGTSNHFRTEVLQAVGGWDAWNVTEDCDLGLRLARGGHETRVLGSTTWEEAASTLAAWIPQRSRWVKGYWQTLLVHTRQPLRSFREFGPWRFCMMLLVVAGHVYALALYPLCWLALIVSQVRGEAIFYPESPYTAGLFVATIMMIACNVIFIGMHAIAAWQRRQPQLWGAALLLPIYWGLMSIAAWKGILQYIWAPFKWEKTPHGLAGAEEETDGAAIWQLPPRTAMGSPLARAFSFSLIAGLVLVAVGGSLYLPYQLKFGERIAKSALTYERPSAKAEQIVDDSWMGRESVAVSVSLDEDVDDDIDLFKAILFVKVTDGEWYQAQTEDCVRHGDVVTATASFDHGDWQPMGTGRPWGPWCLRRVLAVGARLYSLEPDLGEISIRHTRPVGKPARQELAATIYQTPSTAQQNTPTTFDFLLNREYQNPFDPEQIDLAMQIIAPDGSISRAIAFYYQDFERHMAGKKEVLTAVGPPHWRVRFTPRIPGTYSWQLIGKDRSGHEISNPSGTFTATASPRSKFVQVDPHDERYFSFSDGRFFYPIPMTLRSPHDERQPRDADYKVPHPESGTTTMTRYLGDMQESGINLARIWMTNWFGGIEWNADIPGYHGIGQYNLQNARRLDWVLEAAAERDIWVDIVLQNHGAFTTMYDVDWAGNPYNRRNGGPIRRPQEVLTDRRAKKYFAHRLRYIAARWGADPTIFGWTMWTEVDAVNRAPQDGRRWHAEMIPVLKKYDLGNHPVSTHFVSATGDPGVWSQEGIDYVQLAAYNYQEGLVQKIRSAGREMTQYDKPGFIEEYGGGALGGDMAPIAQCIHDGLWLGIMQPGAAAPMAWWWNFVFAKDLDRFHKSAAAFMKDTDLRHYRWRYRHVDLNEEKGLVAAIRQSKTSAYAWIYPEREVALRYGGRHAWKSHPNILSNVYNQRVGKRYDPVNDTAPNRFRAIAGETLSITNLKPGAYRIEFWETWGKGTVTTSDIQCTDGAIRIQLPPLTRDIAVKAIRLPDDGS